jgi:hypothetical protein
MLHFDPLADAVEAAERGNFYYGQVQVSGSYVVLMKGAGKQTFIEGTHELKDRRTEVTFTLNPIEQSGLTQLITRSMIAESPEFSRQVWPSLRDGCGITALRDLDNKFVKVELVKNGRTWNDKKSGELREGTTFKFHAVFVDQAACLMAYEADGNTPRTSTPADAAMAVDMTPSADNSEKEAMWAFMQTLIKQANGDKNTLASMLVGMPMITKYYTVDSPEVTPLLKAA